jgi:hypothetical protein
VTFTVQATNSGSNPLIKWFINGVENAAITGTIYSTGSLINGDKVYVEVTAGMGVTLDNPVENSNELTLHVRSVQQASLTRENGGILKASAGASFEWYFNGNLVQGENGSQIIAVTPGDYYVIVTDEYGCTSTSDAITIAITDLAETLDQINIRMYPNPVKDFVYLQIPEGLGGEASLKIRDVHQRLIYSTQLNNAGSSIQIDLRYHSSGIFFIYVDANEKKYIGKILKE